MLNDVKETTVLFNSRFESGNLRKVTKKGAVKGAEGTIHDFNLYLNFDTRNDHLTQWYYFSVRNIQKGKNIFLS
jgi:hypothetical protein